MHRSLHLKPLIPQPGWLRTYTSILISTLPSRIENLIITAPVWSKKYIQYDWIIGNMFTLVGFLTATDLCEPNYYITIKGRKGHKSAYLCPDAVAMGDGPFGGRGSSQVLISISTLSRVWKQIMDKFSNQWPLPHIYAPICSHSDALLLDCSKLHC